MIADNLSLTRTCAYVALDEMKAMLPPALITKPRTRARVLQVGQERSGVYEG